MYNVDLTNECQIDHFVRPTDNAVEIAYHMCFQHQQSNERIQRDTYIHTYIHKTLLKMMTKPITIYNKIHGTMR